MIKKKIFFCSFIFLFCFSLKAQEENASEFDDLLEWYEDEVISCSELPQTFEEYKNDVQQSHNLSPVLTNLNDFLKMAQRKKTYSREELEEKINFLRIARDEVIAIKDQLLIDQAPIGLALNQCLSVQPSDGTNISCQILPQTFKEYSSYVSLSHQSLNVLFGGLIYFLENVKQNKRISQQEMEGKIKDLEEAETIIFQNKQLLSHQANSISSQLSKCPIKQ